MFESASVNPKAIGFYANQITTRKQEFASSEEREFVLFSECLMVLGKIRLCSERKSQECDKSAIMEMWKVRDQ